MNRRALKRVAVQPNRGAVRGSSANLARVMGVSQATVRSWLADPDDETTYRRMTRGARRLLATVVLLDGAGLLDDKFVAAIDTFDRLLNEGDVRLQRIIRVTQAAEFTNGETDDEDGEE